MALDPIYGKIWKNPSTSLTTGFTTTDGSNGTLLFTADATSGSYLRRVLIMPLGTNVATLCRFYIGTNLISDFPLAAYTLSATASAVPQAVPFFLGIGAGLTFNVQLATTVAGGVRFTAEYMDY